MTAKLVHVTSSPSEADVASDLRDLLRSIGYEVVAEWTAGVSAVLVAGADDGEAAAAIAAIVGMGGAGSLVVVLRPGHSWTPDASLPRTRLIDGSGSVYDILERIAVVLGIEVRTDVFLSYARVDAAAADAVTAALVAQGRKPWVDRRDLEPSDKWLEALRRGIEASDTFLYLLTAASARSPWCRRELAWADEHGKRILPVLLEPVAVEEIPEIARARQYIEIPPGDGVQQHVEKILGALDRDPGIVRMHRRILGEALQWKRDPARVLRGKDLAAAEEWLVAASGVRDPRPTELHTGFIAASRAAQRKRQRGLVALAVVLFAVIAGLAVWALFSAREARRQAAEAKSRLAEQNAFGSYVDWPADPARAFLLADAALRAAPEGDSRRVAYEAMTRNLLQQQPESVTNVETGVSTAAISPDLSRVFVRSSGNRSFVAPLTGRGGRRVELSEPEPFLQYHQARLSADGQLVAAIVKPFFDPDRPHRLVVWRADGLRAGATDLLPLAGERSPEVVGFSRDGRRLLVQSGGVAGVYGAYVFDVAKLDAPIGEPLFRASSLLLLGQVDVPSATAVVVNGDEVRLIDAFTGAARSEPLRIGMPVRQAMVGRGGGSVAVVTGSSLSSWRLEGRTLVAAGTPFVLTGKVFVWDVTPDGSMVVLLNEEASYPAERWSFASRSRVSVPVADRIRTPFIMKAGEEYRPLSFVGDRWLLVREPLRNPLEGGIVQQLMLLERNTLELAAAPFRLPTGYITLLPAREGTRFAVVTREGSVEEWDLLRRPQPSARALEVEGLLYDAQFSPDGATIVTGSQVRVASGLAMRLDLWDTATGAHAGRIGELFETRSDWTRSANGELLAVASAEKKGGQAISLWDLRTRRRRWMLHTPEPVESIVFRAGDTRIATAGITDDDTPRIRVAEYDVATSGPTLAAEPELARNPVHVAFSADGETLIADYQYEAIAFWQMQARKRIDRAYRFNDAVGMRFDLAYDIIRNLRHIRATGAGALAGELPGGVAVALRREGEGTALVPAGSETPVLAAFARAEENVYPVRGTDFLSPSGSWFALGTNVTSVDRASALRVYDFNSGYPVTDLLIHTSSARPGEPWPRLLSTLQSEADPVVAVHFAEEAGELVTVTTNAVVRRWPVLRGASRTPFWSRPADLAAAATGQRLISARALRTIPQDEYLRLRARLQEELAAARGH